MGGQYGGAQPVFIRVQRATTLRETREDTWMTRFVAAIPARSEMADVLSDRSREFLFRKQKDYLAVIAELIRQ